MQVLSIFLSHVTANGLLNKVPSFSETQSTNMTFLKVTLDIPNWSGERPCIYGLDLTKIGTVGELTNIT